ncbi:FXYD domain containing ion transport regulator 5 isoform X3 [Nerophis lumbriciformis]|uniref:FXYD domain containing ion transport regulator 5 isoform X3 n=1 Tax=Nerophis lumbriciformis TaxID=546530 RepID=UPI002AE00A48|nr:uncharacterized protein LOC133599889 isoform X3 [Nerophis lumbriciformis]
MQNQVSQELNTTDREQLLSRFTTRWQQLQSVLHFTWRSSSTYTAAMGTTEAIFPEQRDFEYGQLIPKFPRQRCLLQLCRTLFLCVKPRPANMQHASMFWLLNPRWMIPTNNT